MKGSGAVKKIVLAHLYPNEMNIYGDRGNIIALTKRLEWRGFTVQYQPVEVGQQYDFTKADLVFGGGGQDRGQAVVADDLQTRADNLHHAAADGVVMLLVCGLYQLFGHHFTTMDGEEIPGISLFKASTVGSNNRMIGNVIVATEWGELVGFENHSGQTYLEEGQETLGKVLQGYGNNSQTPEEGAVTGNVFGTYLHGSLLPKNPTFADELLRRALERRGEDPLQPLDDRLERQAAAVAKTRPQ